MNTLNVRCCCTPGLVLGRLPNYKHRSRVMFALRHGETLALHKDIASGSHMTRDCKLMMWSEVAYNSNHTDVETLQQIDCFELVCNIPTLEKQYE